MKTESIVLGGGCFWCLEAAYQQLNGVTEVISGYSGGDKPDPSYDAVSTGASGYVEVVKVMYDPAVISFEQIMAVFWLVHDPTSLNRQGADFGSQYASVAYYADEAQKAALEASFAAAQAELDAPIVTRLEPLKNFYKAEGYHQNYYANNKNAGYCMVVIEPKLEKLRSRFSPLLKS